MPLRMGFTLINNQIAVGWILKVYVLEVILGDFWDLSILMHIRVFGICLINGHGDVDKSWRNSGVRISHAWVDDLDFF